MQNKVETLYPNFAIKVIGTGEDKINARHIIECNGIEVDILADKDGLIVTVQRSEGQEQIGEICHDWKDKTNA